MRSRSGAMFAVAWLSTSTCSRAFLRNSSTDRLAYWMCRPMARSGQSICRTIPAFATVRSEEHTSELQSQSNLVCRLLLEKKKTGQLHEGAPPAAAPLNDVEAAAGGVCRFARVAARRVRGCGQPVRAQAVLPVALVVRMAT